MSVRGVLLSGLALSWSSFAWAQEVGKPVIGDALVVGVAVSPTLADPRFAPVDPSVLALEELRFLPLITYGDNGIEKNIVAERIASQDAKIWRVRIKRGIRFAFGKEMTADDVVSTYKFYSSKEGSASARSAWFGQIADVRRVSNRDVVFSLKERSADFPEKLVVGILPSEAFRTPQVKISGVGFESGPFVGEGSSEGMVFFRKNDKFSAGPLGISSPKVSGVVFRYLSDHVAAGRALERGDVDVVQNILLPEDIAALQKSPVNSRYDFFAVPQNRTLALAFNLRHTVLSNWKVRRAIQKALAIDDMVRFSMYGLATRATSLFPPGFPFHFAKVQPVDQDKKFARELMDQAKFPAPSGGDERPRFLLTISTTNNPEEIRFAKEIGGQLSAVGIGVDVEILERAALKERINRGEASLWLEEWQGFHDGIILEKLAHSVRGSAREGNRVKYANPEVDALLDRARVESRESRRIEFYGRAQQLMAADLPYVFLWHWSATAFVKKGIRGFSLSPDGTYWSLTEVTRG